MKAGAHNQQTDLSAYGTQTPRLTEICFVLFFFWKKILMERQRRRKQRYEYLEMTADIISG